MRTRLPILMIPIAFLLAAMPAAAGEFERYDGARLTEHLFSGGPGKDGIPAMTNPLVGAPDDVDYVGLDELVMGLYINGVARAYPENLGWWHEIINDEVGGQFVTVTLCPLTGTALNFNATDEDGSQIELGVSGQLINSNLVMYDRRDNATLYPQMIYTGINGAFQGEQLELLPIVETTWAMWRRMHPDTEVALAGTGLERYPVEQQDRYADIGRYLDYPYGRYRETRATFFPMTTAEPDLDSGLESKDIVLGICRGGEVKSYAFLDMPDGVVINDVVGGENLVVIFDERSHTAIPYSSVVMDTARTFFAVDAKGPLPIEFMDVETRSRWSMLGQAIDGPLEGERLEQMPAYNSMWFAWDTYWNGADMWAGEGVIEEPPPPVDTAVAEEEGFVPETFDLSQNYPNPFNPTTHIQYSLPRAADVRLAIYNAAGQRVRTLADESQEAGYYLYTWDARDDAGAAVASGNYIYRLETGAARFGGRASQTKVMTLAR